MGGGASTAAGLLRLVCCPAATAILDMLLAVPVIWAAAGGWPVASLVRRLEVGQQVTHAQTGAPAQQHRQKPWAALAELTAMHTGVHNYPSDRNSAVPAAALTKTHSS